MITGFISGVIILFFYWVMWCLWLAIAPSLFENSTNELIVKPKFWQFALVAFAVSLMFKEKQ